MGKSPAHQYFAYKNEVISLYKIVKNGVKINKKTPPGPKMKLPFK
jgi:hypothetical protein